MNKMFFIMFLAVIILITTYVFVRGFQALPHITPIRFLYTVVYYLSMTAFILRMVLGDTVNIDLSYVLSVVGFTWLFAVIYFAFFALAIDIVRIANSIFDIYPVFLKENIQIAKYTTLVVVVILVTSLIIVGNHKFNNPVITKLDVSLNKGSLDKNVKIVMASDLHLSSYINSRDLSKYIKMINEQNPDVVLFVGDVVDRNLQPLIEHKMGEMLRGIKSKFGVYAVSGNHEFYGGNREDIINYFNSYGIKVLRDNSVLVDNSFYIVGREDRTNHNRAPLESLTRGLNRNMPIILMDHQPFDLDQAQKNGVDLQFSGHTHLGQFWPGTEIVKRMYELPYGYQKRESTHYYVSSGLGLWGPKIRLGSNSELVVVNLMY